MHRLLYFDCHAFEIANRFGKKYHFCSYLLSKIVLGQQGISPRSFVCASKNLRVFSVNDKGQRRPALSGPVEKMAEMIATGNIDLVPSPSLYLGNALVK